MFFLIALSQAADHYSGWSYYLGDPHAHTGVSGDGSFYEEEYCPTCATRSNVVLRARNNGLDWVAFADHMNTPSSADPTAFHSLLSKVLMEDRPGTFVTIPAAEVALQTDDGEALGHRTMLFFGEFSQLNNMRLGDLQFDGTGSNIGDCENVAAWASSLQGRFGPLLLMPHHPGAIRPATVDWSCNHPQFEPLAEVYSEHGSSMYADYGWDPPNAGGDPAGSIEQALDPAYYGLKLGFAVGTDSHDSDPGGVCTQDPILGHATAGGLTVVVLPETEVFSRAALYTAFQNRSTYATTGPMIPLQLKLESLGTDLGRLGQDVALPEGQPLTVTVDYPAEFQPWVASVTLRGPGWQREMNPAAPGQWTLRFTPDEAPDLLYAELELVGRAWDTGFCDDGGTDRSEWIWLSPSWVNRVDGDVDGDGWSWSEGDCAEGDPTIGPGALEQWYDGVDQNCDGRDDDQDEDGFGHGQDCDDEDAGVRPDAAELWYDGVDQDCDGRDDDQDEDGFGVARDCADRDPTIHPAASEHWYDGVDQNCDGRDDDQDGDGLLRAADCDDRDPAPCAPESSGCSGNHAWFLMFLPLLRRERRC